MASKFELKRSTDGQFDFHLRAGNGEIVLTSERYKAKASAENGIASVRKNAPDDKNYERKTSKDNKPYFVLKAANHEIIGTSQRYSSAAAMENGIAAVKSDAPVAPVSDLT